jgi:hypothetical protein
VAPSPSYNWPNSCIAPAPRSSPISTWQSGSAHSYLDGSGLDVTAGREIAAATGPVGYALAQAIRAHRNEMQHRRVIRLRLIEQGQAVVEAILAAWADVEATATNGLTQPETEQLTRLLNKIHNNLA